MELLWGLLAVGLAVLTPVGPTGNSVLDGHSSQALAGQPRVGLPSPRGQDISHLPISGQHEASSGTGHGGPPPDPPVRAAEAHAAHRTHLGRLRVGRRRQPAGPGLRRTPLPPGTRTRHWGGGCHRLKGKNPGRNGPPGGPQGNQSSEAGPINSKGHPQPGPSTPVRQSGSWATLPQMCQGSVSPTQGSVLWK